MHSIAILKPNNEIVKGNYNQIRDFCIKECLKDDNIDGFLEFQQQYTYFEPYFDYTMFKLKYILLNPLCQTQKALYTVGDTLYKIKIDHIDYDYIVKKSNAEIEKETTLPFMTKGSDEVLQIENKSIQNMTTCLLDPNCVGLLNAENSSHGITANTILNQILLVSPKISKDYTSSLDSSIIDEDNYAINYLGKQIGFMRITDKKTFPVIIANEPSITVEQKELIEKLKEDGYNYYNLDTETARLTNCYKEIIKKDGFEERQEKKR